MIHYHLYLEGESISEASLRCFRYNQVFTSFIDLKEEVHMGNMFRVKDFHNIDCNRNGKLPYSSTRRQKYHQVQLGQKILKLQKKGMKMKCVNHYHMDI